MIGSARDRVLRAALDLFGEHGVSGTSLQMIADELGVTKAAVYHQFPTKDEIVLAVIDPALARLEPIAEAAERRRTPAARRRVVLAGVVDMVVEYRRLSRVLSFDPVVSRLVRQHPAMTTVNRLVTLLTGTDPDGATRVDVAMVAGGLVLAGTENALTDLDDETLRRHLLTTAARTLRVRLSDG
ncbi:TetR/AcrR family transcriptional regulator [Actinoplanes sp. GCM10030250]|uniref:TetR/AcrR family transcriptional regulator n=1 Tax=Actinoplanes sp. GCM10030250 TaxID=3273376 RepID=UPI0036172185